MLGQPNQGKHDVERSDWAALLAAREQLAYRHDTRPFLSVKGLARQTRFDDIRSLN